MKPYWSQNMIKTRSNTNQTLRVCFYLFLNQFGNKPKNKLVPNDLKILCKLPHDKLVYQNKFPKIQHYSKSEDIKFHCSSPSFSLTAQPHPSVTHTCHGGAAITGRPQNAPTVTLRRGRPHPNNLHTPTDPSPSLEYQKVHRRRLHGDHGGSSMSAHGVTPARMR